MKMIRLHPSVGRKEEIRWQSAHTGGSYRSRIFSDFCEIFLYNYFLFFVKYFCTIISCVQVWDVTANKRVNTLVGHSARVGALAWNGDMLSSGSRDRLVFKYFESFSTIIPLQLFKSYCAECDKFYKNYLSHGKNIS